MEGRNESQVSRRRRWRFGVPALLVLGAALALGIVSAGSGSSGATQATPGVISTGKGFGEVYAAKTSTLKHTLFKATLIPKDKMSRNIALAGLGRADRKVNEALALRCWKNNGCKTGTGGKLKVAYIEQFGENVYRQMSKMEFILQALTYPQVGEIIYSSAHVDFNKAFADWKAAIAQGVDVIVTYAWGYVTDPGKNYLAVVGEDTCVTGKTYAYIMNSRVKSGKIALLGGFAGNPLSEGWQKCEVPALRNSIDVVAKEPTDWNPSKVQQVVAGILAKNPDIKGWSYEYGLGMGQGGYAAYKAAGKPFQGVMTFRTDDVGMGCLFNQLNDPKLEMYYTSSFNSHIRVALTAGMMKLKGAKIPPKIVFPIEMQNQRKRDSCVKGYPMEASATSLIPLSLLKKMYP